MVRSALDRAIDSIRDGVNSVRNALKTQDWSNVQEKFETVSKLLEKSRNVLGSTGTPKFYIRMLVDLEEAIAEVSKEQQKKMKAAVNHSFSRVKLNVPKYNKAFEAEIRDCKANPEAYEDVVESEESSDAGAKKKGKGKKGSDDSSSESESGSGSEDDVSFLICCVCFVFVCLFVSWRMTILTYIPRSAIWGMFHVLILKRMADRHVHEDISTSSNLLTPFLAFMCFYVCASACVCVVGVWLNFYCIAVGGLVRK